MYPVHKNSNDKPRPIPKMSARKLARFRSENAGAYPRSTIQRKEKLCTNTSAHSVKEIGNARLRKTLTASFQKNSSAKRAEKKFYRASKPIPSRKKRSTTPIRSTPWPNALDSRSYVLNGRVQLFGADKRAMRERIFARAGGRCEERIEDEPGQFVRCNATADEWSHDRHGANQSDAFDAGIASCSGCHRRRHGQY